MAQSKIQIWNRALVDVGESRLIDDEAEDSPEAGIARLCYEDVLREVLGSRAWPFATKLATLVSIASQSQSFAGDNVLQPLTFDVPFGFDDISQVTVVKDSVTLVAGTDFTYALPTASAAGTVTLPAFLPTGSTLAITVAVTRNGWEYIYALPADFVRAVALVNEDDIRLALGQDYRLSYDIVPKPMGDGFLLVTNEDGFEGLEYIALMTNPLLYSGMFVNCLAWRLAAEFANGVKKDTKLGLHCLQMYERTAQLAFAEQANQRYIPEPETPSLAIRR